MKMKNLRKTRFELIQFSGNENRPPLGMRPSSKIPRVDAKRIKLSFYRSRSRDIV
jgi:hypothetical protein